MRINAQSFSLRNVIARLALCGVGALAFPQLSMAEIKGAGPVQFDLMQSYLKWEGRKVTGSHHGKLKLRSADASIGADGSLQGEFQVDMASLQVDDIKDPTDNAKLAGHLKSDDFFGVKSHPAATFRITKSSPIPNAKAGEPNTMITGDLAITGISQQLTFPARVEIKDDVVHADATVKVDRTRYNIRYGSGKFFENLGDKLIYDEFTVDLTMVGKLG